MDEFEVMVTVLIAAVGILCCFAVVGIAFTFFRFLG